MKIKIVLLVCLIIISGCKPKSPKSPIEIQKNYPYYYQHIYEGQFLDALDKWNKSFAILLQTPFDSTNYIAKKEIANKDGEEMMRLYKLMYPYKNPAEK